MAQSGKSAFLKQGEKLKREVEEKQTKEDKSLVEVKNSLDAIKQNKDLQALYQESEGVGTQNLQGSLPLLKVHSTGRSSTNQLADGSDPNDGNFFYKPTQEQFKEIDAHILTVSKGYRADGMEGKTNVFHQVLAGVITNDGILKPFIMFFTGIKLRTLWDFCKEAGDMTKNKSMPIPLFALKVKMITEKQKTDYGYSWIVKFNIVKSETGFPELVVDPMLFRKLRSAVAKAEDMISSLIETKSTGNDEPQNIENVTTLPAEKPEEAKDVSIIDEDGIPF